MGADDTLPGSRYVIAVGGVRVVVGDMKSAAIARRVAKERAAVRSLEAIQAGPTSQNGMSSQSSTVRPEPPPRA